jgi:hypothetical protein
LNSFYRYFLGIELKKNFSITYTWIVTTSFFATLFWNVVDYTPSQYQEKLKSIPFVDPGFLHEIIPLLLNTSIILIIITPLIFIINLLLVIFKHRALSHDAIASFNYNTKHPTEQDIDEIVAFGKRLIGELFNVDAETIKSQYSINQKIITCLYDSKPDKKLIGYFIIYPLTLTAFNQIITSKISNGKGILNKHICKHFDDAVALYVGMVGGLGKHAEGYVIFELIETLRVLIRNKNLKAIFARGATEDGKRVINEYDFNKLASPSEISVLFVNDELYNHPRILRHFKSGNRKDSSEN